MDIIKKNYQAIKKLLIFQPPQTPSLFVLPENESDTGLRDGSDRLPVFAKKHDELLRYARRLAGTLEKVKRQLEDNSGLPDAAALKAELVALEKQLSANSPLVKTYNYAQDPLDLCINTSLEENKLILETLYNLPDNKDLVVRDFAIPAAKPDKAFMVFMDGLVDKNTVSLTVLQPLMLLSRLEPQQESTDPVKFIITKILPNNQTRTASSFREAAEGINRGDTAIFLDGASEVILVETKGQEHRGVDRPAMEQSVRSSQAGFTETLRINTALVRSLLRANDLTTEMLTIGTRSNTSCALMYLKSVINPLLVEEARRRLTSLKIDTLLSSGSLELMLNDFPMIPFPQALSTERPDRVAAGLCEGRLAILLDGCPFALVAPVSIYTLLHAAEDFAFSWFVGSFTRFLRLAATLLTVLLPSFYLAISYFHQEALPTNLILAIAGAREKVPFPSLLEVAMMEFSFEMLREAGVRIPSMLGATIGIVGAIILGQAAVSAGIVSPITVVIIAITGLASFAIADYSLAAAIRLTRFGFEILAISFGLVGVASGLTLIGVMLCTMKSLGVPYLAPLAPKTRSGYDIFLRGPVYSQELRPDDLNAIDRRRQASVARGWLKRPPAGKGGKD